MDKMLKDPKTILIMVLPATLIFLIFIPIPAITSLFLSFTKWNLIGKIRLIGFDNFAYMLHDDYVFWIALRNTFIFVILSMIFQLPMAFLLANILYRMKSGRNIFRNIIFLPVTFSGVAVSLMFYFVYHPKMGILNNVLKIFIPDINFPWLADSHTALVAVIATMAWQWIGYHMIIYLSGMSSIPQELLEAARIDGATEWQSTWHIIFPMLLPIILVSTVLLATSSLKSFDQIFIMTFGGPNHASEVLASLMYTKTFAQQNYGYGSALSVVLVLLCILSTLLLGWIFKSGSAGRE